jgi:adenylate kinase family enzyme
MDAVISKIEKISKSDKNYIIEGFPKNLRQAHILQRKGVYAKNILIININNAGLR